MTAQLSTVDPKVFFANERTFLKWLHTSVTIGSVGTGLLGVAGAYGNGGAFAPVRLVGLLLLLLAIAFCIHAL